MQVRIDFKFSTDFDALRGQVTARTPAPAGEYWYLQPVVIGDPPAPPRGLFGKVKAWFRRRRDRPHPATNELHMQQADAYRQGFLEGLNALLRARLGRGLADEMHDRLFAAPLHSDLRGDLATVLQDAQRSIHQRQAVIRAPGDVPAMLVIRQVLDDHAALMDLLRPTARAEFIDRLYVGVHEADQAERTGHRSGPASAWTVRAQLPAQVVEALGREVAGLFARPEVGIGN